MRKTDLILWTAVLLSTALSLLAIQRTEMKYKQASTASRTGADSGITFYGKPVHTIECGPGLQCQTFEDNGGFGIFITIDREHVPMK